ncbi:MAG: pre-peptidase C-terminal domain-containing protein [Planctomycetaceae bacterium]
MTPRRLHRRIEPKQAWVGLESLETRILLAATVYDDENDKLNEGTVGTVQDPFQVGGVSNPFGQGLDITGGPVGKSGAVAIDGGDRDDHGSVDPGPDGTPGTTDDINQNGWLYIQQLTDFGIRGHLNNASDDILAVGASGNSLAAIQSAAAVLSLNVTAVTGAALQSVDFTDYKLMYVPSDSSNSFSGGITDADLAILEARKLDVQEFVNTGGSIVALTEDSAANPYGWLELPDLFIINGFGGGGISEPLRKTQAAIDAGLTISDQELSNGVPYHNEFIGPPGFNGLQPFVLDASNRIITLGLASGSFGIGFVGNDDHGQSINQATSLPINNTQSGEITFDGDADFFRVHLQAGKTYVFDAKLGTIGDTTLVLYASDGKTILAFDDDGGLGRASRIVFTPQTSGTYYLNVRAYNYQDRGTFSLNIKEAQDGPIAIPSLIGPITTTVDDTPTFTWNAVAGAASYELRVNNLTTGQQNLIFEVVAGTSFTSAVSLVQGDSYEWKVRAITSKGTVGEFSQSKYFNVQGGLDDHADVPADATDIVPGVWQGNMNFLGDEDWFRVVTVPGTTYRVTTTGGVGATLFDDTVAGISDPVGSTLLNGIDSELIENVVDGTLEADLGNNPLLDTSLFISNGASLDVGTIIQIDDELMEITGGFGINRTVTRGFDGTTVANHFTGADVIVRSIRVDDPAAFPTTTPFTVRVGNEEMQVTEIGAGINADRFIVTRAFNSTTRDNHFIDDDVLQTGTVTLTVLNTGSFPAVPGFVVQIDNERFQVTGIAGNVFTATRAFHNTTAAIHIAGAFISLELFGGESILQFTATDEGPYFIQIKHPTGQVGPYSMTVSGLPGDTHGDNAATAFPINLNETIEAKIETHRDEDWFVFVAPHDGHFVFETGLNTLVDSLLELYDADGTTLLQSDDDSGVGRASKIERDMLTGQTIYLRALGSDGRIGSYSVKVGETLPDDHLNNALVPLGLAQLLLNNPIFGNGNIEQPGDQDWFKIDAVAGQGFVLETVAGTLTDTTMTLFDSDGTTQLAFDDDNGPGKLSRIQFTPTHTGSYFIRIKAFSAVMTGTYQVTYNSASLDDFGNNAAAAAAILVNTNTSGKIETNGDQDWFKFVAVAGQDYVFETMLGSNPDTVLTLIDTNGTTVIKTNDDGGLGKASRITWQAAANGTYFLKVTSFGAQQKGTYQLQVIGGSDDHGDNSNDPTAVMVNSSTPGDIELPLDQDWYTVDLFANTFYRFEIEMGDLEAARFTLLDQDGNTVIETTETTTGILLGKNFIEFLAPSTGTYFLKVQSLGSTQSGNYLVNVIEPLVSGVGTPILLMPKGIITETRFPIFSWTAASQAERYVLRVDDLTSGQQMVIFESNLTTTSFTSTTPLKNGHVYRWTVQAFNDTSGKSGLPSLGQNFVMQLVDDHSDSAIGSTFIPVNGGANGEFEMPGDQDWFNFKAKQDADYVISVNLGTLTDSTLELIDKNGTTVLVFNDNSGSGLGSQIVWNADDTGTYYLRVKPKTPNLTGTYNVTLLESLDDHGNAANKATFVQAPSVTGGNIELPGDQDWFRILAIKGVTYDFSTILGSLPGTTLTLYGTNGVSVLKQDLSSGASNLSFTATATGSVFVAVRSFGVNQTGTYTFRVTSSADDHGNNALSSTPISINSITAGNIEAFGDQDWFSITLAGNQTYILETSLFTLPNGTLTVYDVNGITILETDDDSGQGLASRIEFTPSASATYFLKVQAFNSSQVGTYSLSVTQESEEKLTVGPNVNVSKLPFNQVDVTIAVNPNNSNNLIAAANSLDDTKTNDSIWFSNNGGQTWSQSLIPNTAGTVRPGGDPTVVFDRTGTAYYAHLKFENSGTLISVARSTNGGQTWTAVDVPTPAGNADKDFFGIGPDVNNLSQDRLYLAYHVGAIQYINSSTDGVNWSAPTQVSDGSASGYNSQVAVDAAGKVYMAWQEINDATPGVSRVRVDVSTDGGTTWGIDTTAYTSNVPVLVGPQRYNVPAAPDYGIGAFLSMDVDNSGGPNDGNVYIALVDQGDLDGNPDVGNAADHDDTDVFLIRSTNGGQSWSGPVRVNDDSTINSQFLPWMDIDQTTGNIAVGWYDARNDDGLGGPGDTDALANTDVQYFVTASLDGGLTFLSNVQVSAGTSNQNGAEPYPAGTGDFDYGDYTGIAFQDNEIHAVWADNSNSTTDNPEGTLETQDVYYATVTLSGGVTPPTTFELHSNPGAKHTVYLDFDGHITSGTAWNTDFTSGADIVTPAYDFDGDVTFFSTEELDRIEAIWARVAEDFLPFNVDVTTQDPGLAGLVKSGVGDDAWGIRVAIGGSYTDWLLLPAGGIAYVGSFNDSIDTPTFVFEEDLGDGDEKFTSEATSHEVGHTLGLVHDGRTNPLEEYYQGTPTWAPIMGVGYSSSLVQWSKGEYANASNTEDDLAKITTNNGFGYRVDDHGNTFATASTMVTSGTSVSASGIISQTTDVDVFSFTTGAGSVDLTINSGTSEGNLNVLAELFDSTGTLIVSANPASNLNATINATLAAGTYFVRIDGVGEGDPTATGYSDYGSLGAFTITGTAAGALPGAVSSSLAPSKPLAGNGASLFYAFTANPTFTGSVTSAKLGTSSAVQVLPFNPITVNGSTIEVNGTNGLDEISVSLGTQHTITVNGTDYQFNAADVQRIELNGMGGDDILHVTGTSGKDTVTMRPGTLEFTGTGITLSADSFAAIDVKSGGGQDLAYLFDSAGNDTYSASPTSAKMQGSGYSNRVDNYRRVYAYSYAGGYDTAQLKDSAGNDNFVGEAVRSWMTGNGYYNSAARFEQVNAYSTTGYDVAMMWDSTGNDVFQVNPNMGSLTGTNFSNRAHTFDRVYAYAYNGGTDEARMYDSSGDDRFVGKEARSILFNDTYYASVSRFERVYAIANAGGNDRADLYGSTGSDHLASGPNKSTMSGATYLYEVSNFESLNAYAVAGGVDTASLSDSSGNDMLIGTTDVNYMVWSNNNRATLNRFDAIDVLALLGGNDTAEFRGLGALDEVFGQQNLAIVERSSGKNSRVMGFDKVIAQSLSATGPVTDLTSLDYVFSKTGAWS